MINILTKRRTIPLITFCLITAIIFGLTAMSAVSYPAAEPIFAAYAHDMGPAAAVYTESVQEYEDVEIKIEVIIELEPEPEPESESAPVSSASVPTPPPAPEPVLLSVVEPAPEPEPEPYPEPYAYPAPEPAVGEFISLGIFELTAYCLCARCCGIWSAEHPSRIGTGFVQRSASGTIPQAGRTIAVDTSVIPFGTYVKINGHVYIAEDRGGAIRGNKIDILKPDHETAMRFGRQRAEVFIKVVG